jgi:hypothetical protein
MTCPFLIVFLDLGNLIKRLLHVLKTSSSILHLNLSHVFRNVLIYCNISESF